MGTRGERESERLRWLEGAVRQAPALIGVTRGPEHRFELISDLMAAAVGRERTVEGRLGPEALPELAEQGFFEVVDEVLRTGEPFVGREVPARLDRRGDGELEETLFDYVYQPIRGPDGRIEGVMAHASDVTDMVRARRAAEAAHARLAALIREAPDGIVVVDAEGRVRSANPAAERIFGRREGELVGRELPWPEERREAARQAFDRLLRREPVEPRRVELTRPDGATCTVEAHASVGTDPDGSPRVELVLRDIGERVREEERRRQLERRLMQTQRMEAIGRLASGVAHDFNNLLSVVLSESELLLEHACLDAEAREGASAVREAAERASSLVRSLLAFTRQQQLAPVDVDLGAMVRALRPILERVVGRERTLRVEVGAEDHGVRADPSQLEQVVVNLVVNARDATPPGGVIEVGVAAQTGDGEELPAEPHVCVRVADTGCGMPPEVAEHIFEPFFTTKAEAGGTGLGLATAHGVVTQSGGRILVRSAPGEGTELRVCLPRRDGSA